MRNGKMHGEGKFTWKDGTVYEGKFKRNEITGTGKYVWPDGTSYIGEVKNGIRHGKGVFLNPKEGYKYEGEWKSGLRHGKGILTYQVEGEPGVFTGYEGNWKEGEKSGSGKYIYPSGNSYEGEWLHNKRNGKGTMCWKRIGNNITNEKYVGQWKDDLQSGFGTHIWLDEKSENKVLRNRYVGYWKNGVREGHGMFFYANGSMYIGQWKNNMKDGWGKFVYEDGNEFEGYYNKDRMVEKSLAGNGTKTLTAGIQAAPDLANALALQKEIEKVAKSAPKPPAKTEKQKEVPKPAPAPKGKVEVDSNPYSRMIDNSDLIALEQLTLEPVSKTQGSPTRSPSHTAIVAASKPKEPQEELNNIMLTHHSELKQWYKFFTNVDRTEFEEGFMMVNRQFWRLLGACKVLNVGFSLAQFNRIFLKGKKTFFSLKYNPFDGNEVKKEGEWRPTTTDSEMSKKENKTSGAGGANAPGNSSEPIKLIETKKEETLEKAEKSGLTPVKGDNAENSRITNILEDVGAGEGGQYDLSEEDLPLEEIEPFGKEDVHDPYRPLLFRHFAEAIIRSAHLYYINDPSCIKTKLNNFFAEKLKPQLPEVSKRGKKKELDAPKPSLLYLYEEAMKPFDHDLFDIFKMYSKQSKDRMEKFADYTLQVKTFAQMVETALGKNVIKTEELVAIIDSDYDETCRYSAISKKEGVKDDEKQQMQIDYVHAIMATELIYYEYKGLILELIKFVKKQEEIKEEFIKSFVEQWVGKLKRKETRVKVMPKRIWQNSQKDIQFDIYENLL